MVIFLLIIIAIGVLLISEPGQALLGFFIGWGIRLLLIGIVGVVLIVGYFYLKSDKQDTQVNIYTKTSNSSQVLDYNQKPETRDDIFPMDNIGCNQSSCDQYAWYDRHNVAMAYRCYPGNCTSEQWAFAVYANSNDSRGIDLKKQSDVVYEKSRVKYSSEKCVTEHDVKICDLKYSSKQRQDLPLYRDVTAEGNSISCIEMNSGDVITNNINSIRAKTGSSFCVSDFGYVYIDPNLKVNKYWDLIERSDNSSPYKIQKNYDTCIWTWADGNGNIPYMEIFGNVGTRSGYSVKAFCKNGNDQVDIYSYRE
ncbi:MAG: hypothetical protein RI935_476 [Candidatus Parcubacteria bacterium]|jgi:hypothetical protein